MLCLAGFSSPHMDHKRTKKRECGFPLGRTYPKMDPFLNGMKDFSFCSRNCSDFQFTIPIPETIFLDVWAGALFKVRRETVAKKLEINVKVKSDFFNSLY